MGELTIAQQQIVQIATAVSGGARIIVFDEPTSSLSQAEADRLYAADRTAQGARRHVHLRVASNAGGLPAVRHRERAARRTARRDAARRRAHRERARADDDRPPAGEYLPQRDDAQFGDEVLRVERLSLPGKFEDVIVLASRRRGRGMAGLVGAGRSEVAQALFGLDPPTSGTVFGPRQGRRDRHARRRDAISASVSCRKIESDRGSCSRRERPAQHVARRFSSDCRALTLVKRAEGARA